MRDWEDDPRRDLIRLEEALRVTFAKLGLGPVELMVRLNEEWDDVAGEPWIGISRPVVLRGGELLVEADLPSAVRVLSYDTGELLRRLDSRFGPGSVSQIRVVAKR
ncbi:MAG: DUF721 domain-containing protein [Acidimicrobiia bacterium]